MNAEPEPTGAEAQRTRKVSGNVIVGVVTALFSLAAVGVVLWFALSTPNSSSRQTTNVVYPIGSAALTQPSGLAPPSANALSGYTRSYVDNFNGASIPAGWNVFTGVPGGDPGAQFGGHHVVVSGGLLQLNTYKDPAFHDEVVTGGICQCGLANKYGAYFIRSRVTGPGPNDAELLWPKVGWPPEIDFNENGGSISDTSSTLHFSSTNQMVQNFVTVNMTQWHTWGVIWTPSSIILVVDGREWGEYTTASEIPQRTMTLDLEQRTSCSKGLECPTVAESMEIDWVAEYVKQ